MQERELRRYLRRSFRPMGWTMVIYYGILNLVVMAVLLGDMFLQLVAGKNPEMNLGNAWGYLDAILVGAVILYAWKGGGFFEERILTRGKSCTPVSILALIVLMLGLQLPNSLFVSFLDAVTKPFGGDILGNYEELNLIGSDSLSMFLYAGLFAPISEEVLFRGLILRSAEPFGRRFAVFVSAFFFGLFHGNLVQMPYAFLVGLILGYTALEYNIGWSILLHMVNNLLYADTLSRLFGQLSEEAAYLAQMGISAALTLAALGILLGKRRKIRQYFAENYLDSRCMACFFTNSGTILFILIMLGATLMSI